MATTPKRAGRKAREGSLFLSEVVTRNLKAYRALRQLTQEDLAQRMTRLGLTWTGQIASAAERGDRTISVDELAGLAVVLEVPVPRLLDSRGPALATGPYLDLGGGRVIPPPLARWLTTSADLDDEQSHAIAALAGVTSADGTTTGHNIKSDDDSTNTTDGEGM